MEGTVCTAKALSHKMSFFLMQCAYNLVPSNFNGMILVIALEQQKQLFHVGKCNAI